MLIGWLGWNISDPHCQCEFVKNIRCVVSLIVPESCGVRIYCLPIAFETVASEQLHLNLTGVPMIMLYSMYSIRVLQNVEFAGKLSGAVPFPWQLCLKSTFNYDMQWYFFCKWSWSLIEKKSFHGNRSSSFLFLFSWVLGNPRIMWCNGITLMRFVLRSFCGLSFLSFGVGDLQITECFWCSALRVRCHGPRYEICFGDNVAAEGSWNNIEV